MRAWVVVCLVALAGCVDPAAESAGATPVDDPDPFPSPTGASPTPQTQPSPTPGGAAPSEPQPNGTTAPTDRWWHWQECLLSYARFVAPAARYTDRVPSGYQVRDSGGLTIVQVSYSVCQDSVTDEGPAGSVAAALHAVLVDPPIPCDDSLDEYLLLSVFMESDASLDQQIRQGIRAQAGNVTVQPGIPWQATAGAGPTFAHQLVSHTLAGTVGPRTWGSCFHSDVDGVLPINVTWTMTDVFTSIVGLNGVFIEAPRPITDPGIGDPWPTSVWTARVAELMWER